jgi:hypothetical protein
VERNGHENIIAMKLLMIPAFDGIVYGIPAQWIQRRAGIKKNVYCTIK